MWTVVYVRVFFHSLSSFARFARRFFSADFFCFRIYSMHENCYKSLVLFLGENENTHRNVFGCERKISRFFVTHYLRFSYVCCSLLLDFFAACFSISHRLPVYLLHLENRHLYFIYLNGSIFFSSSFSNDYDTNALFTLSHEKWSKKLI